ncbi:SagB/ThcOx family dehydrogenase [Mammaliicoccus sciuri]|uniref:SagB/ThcOx family dehydrogenase n=1 Tax=Mammaliicoccus sciuri TaxID=1296 RepID=UPI00195245FB|nr:SagB/ThcOx family dehydrogenase [Mammaliicoccus sciuri]MEB6096061.1 SagB/ThcOx family dehydrogenase [Mammaliicoccus sciuri]MEB8129141.1 SagB/ThcOx family dehydrogenase [Mammaliicoccus sciuri]
MENMYEKFHLNTNNYPSQSIFKKGESYIYKITPEQKSLRTISLNNFFEDNYEVKRGTSRIFDSNVPLKKISLILNRSYLFDKFNKNIVPSAGGFYPIDIYVYFKNNDVLEEGFYYYNPIDFQLEVINITTLRDEKIFWGNNIFAYNAPVIIFFVANISYSYKKYGDKAYRFALIESGHICQKVIDNALELGVKYCPIGGYWEERIEQLLNTSDKQHLLYLLALG